MCKQCFYSFKTETFHVFLSEFPLAIYKFNRIKFVSKNELGFNEFVKVFNNRKIYVSGNFYRMR